MVKIKAKEKGLNKKGDQVELFYKMQDNTELWWITMPRKWSETVPKSQKDHEKQLFYAEMLRRCCKTGHGTSRV